ncbi:FtsW/RodA/SpoVE family cell cycle protein [Aquihabitans sp. G128]|uniref:FtsW/RodA/SpoVE family cell cycle protein n=1 Tax=Aquihabitans sp. G128 TaxID=2849779 RepID=UPI001C234A6D|nr:FtsW/RodA/SpoVE family cell cycle protein [Aquihabitans sp. G128]QXC59731.1 FtsW/RodA/SpoVE family cell cycle protein [Aquihabitans sp. G128]
MTAVGAVRRPSAGPSVLGQSRRRAELGLIVMAVAITGALYTLAGLGKTASVPANIGPFLAVIAVLFLTAHLAVRRLAPMADGILLPVAALLNGIGYVFIARLKPSLAPNQATWTGVGIIAFVVTLAVVRRTRDLERYRYTFLLGGLGLLVLPLVPGLGLSINGARIWAHLGPISFQPGEFAKIALALFFASYLVEKRELLSMATWPKFRPVLPDLKHLGPVLLAWGVAVLVMTAETDLGSSLLLFGLFMAMLWVATGRVGYPVGGTALFGVAAYGAWTQFGHVQDRVTNWLNPWADPLGRGNQVVQAWYALAWGGVAGTGIGLGRPDRIPVVENDFIFAAIGEELGLLGATGLLMAYLIFVGSGLRVATQAEHAFDKLLAAGLTALMGLQSFVIIAGVIRVLPLTGVVLPFISYGGSATVANYVLLALLLRISAETTAKRSTKATAGAAA